MTETSSAADAARAAWDAAQVAWAEAQAAWDEARAEASWADAWLAWDAAQTVWAEAQAAWDEAQAGGPTLADLLAWAVQAARVRTPTSEATIAAIRAEMVRRDLAAGAEAPRRRGRLVGSECD